jgi:hypothetical protein
MDNQDVEALFRELMEQLERVGADMQEASPRLREIAPPVERRISKDEFEVTRTLDVSGIIATLRGMPSGAGTDAFIKAYNARNASL